LNLDRVGWGAGGDDLDDGAVLSGNTCIGGDASAASGDVASLNAAARGRNRAGAAGVAHGPEEWGRTADVGDLDGVTGAGEDHDIGTNGCGGCDIDDVLAAVSSCHVWLLKT